MRQFKEGERGEVRLQYRVGELSFVRVGVGNVTMVDNSWSEGQQTAGCHCLPGSAATVYSVYC